LRDTGKKRDEQLKGMSISSDIPEPVDEAITTMQLAG